MPDNWEVVKRNSGLSHSLVFRNGTAYGFDAAQDAARAELDGYRSAARAALAVLPAARERESLDALVDYIAERRN